jgi:hypothetical protein
MNKNQKGINNPNFKHGNNCQGKKCLDCGKVGIHVQAIRCETCEDKHHALLLTGKPSKTKGIKRVIHRCSVCRKIILQTTTKNTGLCKKCHEEFIKVHPEFHPRFGHVMKPNWIEYKSVWMRSNWESGYARYLDLNRITWQYEPKTFDLGETTYTPDFYLPETDEYIEIKGYKSDIFIKKFKLFKQIYSEIKIKILDKESLNDLGIINKRGDLIKEVINGY